jgi:hypothetical protein
MFFETTSGRESQNNLLWSFRAAACPEMGVVELHSRKMLRHLVSLGKCHLSIFVIGNFQLSCFSCAVGP